MCCSTTERNLQTWTYNNKNHIVTRCINYDCKICGVGQDNWFRSKSSTCCYDNRIIKYDCHLNCQFNTFVGLKSAKGGLQVLAALPVWPIWCLTSSHSLRDCQVPQTSQKPSNLTNLSSGKHTKINKALADLFSAFSLSPAINTGRNWANKNCETHILEKHLGYHIYTFGANNRKL